MKVVEKFIAWVAGLFWAGKMNVMLKEVKDTDDIRDMVDIKLRNSITDIELLKALSKMSHAYWRLIDFVVMNQKVKGKVPSLIFEKDIVMVEQGLASLKERLKQKGYTS